MGITLGLVGLDRFGSEFAPLFKAHPLVDKIVLCDAESERIAKFANDPFFADKFNPNDSYTSFDNICKSDADALVIITQPWLHAPQCIQALKAGKDVYSAVPVMCLPDGDEVLDWCDQIINVCQQTGQRYMLGETTCFRPQAMFCRRKMLTGEFGDIVYAEGEYMHDVDAGCNLRQVNRDRTASATGRDWPERAKQYANRGKFSTPMDYPTHSVSGPIFCMQTRARKVNAWGYKNKTNDSHFAHSDFSNIVAMYELANGATLRVAEMRELAGRLSRLESECFRIVGTQGTFSEDIWYYNKRIDEHNLIWPPQQEELQSEQMFEPLPVDVYNAFLEVENLHSGNNDNQVYHPTGHGGSHPYLVHEFVSCVAEQRQAVTNAWEAGHYMAMGVAASKSARRDGESIPVQDWGVAPC